MEPEQIEIKIEPSLGNASLTLTNPEIVIVQDSPQVADSNSVHTVESSSKASDDPYKIIEDQKNIIKSLTTKVEEIQESLDMLKEEKIILTSEIRDMSGSLIEEAYKSINDINESKELLKDELKRVKQNESALKVQNQDLRALVEEMNKATRFQFSALIQNQSSGQQTSTKTPIVNFGFNKPKPPRKIIPPLASTIKTDIFVPEISYMRNETYYGEFVEWYEGGCHPDTKFFKSILRDETYPCLSFNNSELQSIARTYMESWNANPTIEKDSSNKEKVCDFTKKMSKDNYMVKFNSERVYIACSYVRLRIVSVVDMYIYIRYIALGIVKSSIDEMFKEVIRLRVRVSMTRLGYSRN